MKRGTRPWTTYGEGPTQVVAGEFHDTATKPFTAQDIRFTTKDKDLYAIALGWPKDGHLTIHALGHAQQHKDSSRVAAGIERRDQVVAGDRWARTRSPGRRPEITLTAFGLLSSSPGFLIILGPALLARSRPLPRNS